MPPEAENDVALPAICLRSCPACDSDDVTYDPETETWDCEHCGTMTTQLGVEILHGESGSDPAQPWDVWT